MLSETSGIALNIFLSIILCKKLGVLGLGIATCAGAAANIIIYSSHFLRKSNSIHFKFSWCFNNLLYSFKLSYCRTINSMFVAFVDIIMNKIIIVNCGEEMIPVYSVVNLLFNMFIISAAAFDSCSGFCSNFVGEKNNYGIINVLKTCAKTGLWIGVGLNVIFFFLAKYIPVFYGMESPEVIEASVFACRIMSFSAIPYSIAYMLYGMYPTFDKASISFIIVILLNLICPLITSIPMAYLMGINGVSLGMSLSSFMVMILFVLIVRAIYGKEGFPLYLEDTGEEVVALIFM